MSNDKSMKQKEWIRLDNGNLIMFLHHHLPFLQAKSKVEWNALGNFLKLLDYVFSINENTSEIRVTMPKKQIMKFGSGKYFNEYLENFFLDEPFVYSSTKNNIPITYFVIPYLNTFISEVQKYLLNTLGEKEYFSPLKIDLSTLVEKDAYGVKLSESTFMDKNMVKYSKLLELAYNGFSIRKSHPILSTKYVDKAINSLISVNKQKDLISFYGFKDRTVRNVKFDKKLLTFNTKKDSPKQTLLSSNTMKNEITTEIVLNSKELNDLLNEAITKNTLDLHMLYNMKTNYLDNTNFVVYTERNIRLYTLAESNNINFQGLSKDLRKKLFKGLWQYDIEVAAPTILCELFKRFNPNKKINILDEYIKNRNVFRKEWADYLVRTFNVDKDKAYTNIKEIITALFYNSNILNSRSKVRLDLEKRKSLVENVPKFESFKNEVKELSKNIYDYYVKNHQKDNKINCNGYLIDLDETDKNGKTKKKSVASIVSSIYFCYERAILDIVRKKFDNVTLFLHDGFIIPNKIDVQQLENDIYLELELKVKYDEEEL